MLKHWEDIKWMKEKKFQTKEYMRHVIILARLAIKRDILKTRRYALYVQARVVKTISSVCRQGVWVAIPSFGLCIV
jgi:hypothetical protein